MGMDSIEPWLSYAESRGKGAFVLLKTSNKGMKDFQYLELAAGKRRLYHAVGDRLADLAVIYRGKYGYGAFGAVVGADPKSGAEREEAAAIRECYNSLFFLIPGYGAQGGAAEDADLLLREGNGGVVNASRSILKAWTTKAANSSSLQKDKEPDNEFAAEAAREAVLTMRDTIRTAVKK